MNGRDRWLVRLALEQDFDQLFGIVSAVAEEDKWIGAQAPLDRLTTISRWTADLVDPNAARFVIEEQGEIVGEANVHLNAGRADLGMQVAEPYRGLGVGTALMEAVLAWAQTQGAHKITLQVWPHNHAARRLYQRFGFVSEGRLRRHYRRRTGELWDAVIMGRVLDLSSPGSRFVDEE